MHRSLRAAIAVLASVAIVSAITVDTLTSGTAKVDALIPTTSASAYDLKYYQVWVPENASTVTIDFTVSDIPDCSYLHVYQRTQGLPCSSSLSSTEFRCNSQAFDPQNGVAAGDTDTRVHTAYTSNVVWTVGAYFYIGVGRDYLSDAPKACAFTLKATVATCPTAGQTATADFSTQTCVATSEQTSSTPVTFPVLSTQYQVVKRWLPVNSVAVNVTVYSNNNGLYIYGRSGSVPSPSEYDCYTGSPSTIGTGAYAYNFNCQLPRFGQYFYVLVDQDTTTPTTIQVAVDIVPFTCSNSTGGNLCHYPIQPLSEATTAPFTLYASDYTDSDGSFKFFYVDVPQGTNANANATFAVSTILETGTGYMYAKRNAYVTGSDYEGYQSLYEGDTTTYAFAPEDLWAGGRFIFGLQAYTGNLTVSLAGQTSGTGQTTTGAVSTTATTTAAVTTTGSTTGTATTTGSTTAAATTGGVATTGEPDSSASIASVSFVAVAVAVLAMF